MTKKIMLFSKDPGGANTVIAMHNPLKQKGYEVKLFGAKAALKKYQQNNLTGEDIHSYIAEVSLEGMYKFLKQESPDLILTGTSSDEMCEKYIWKAAKQFNIPSFAILDQWINYGIRFSPYSVFEADQYEQEKFHPYLPTKIFVMDDYAKNEMIKTGISPSVVEVSGQPYFEYLKKKAISHSKQENIVVTYASEPLSQSYKDNYWGYTEKTIFKNLLTSLEKLDEKISLIIKLHPKENEDNYSEMKSSSIDIRVDKDSDALDLIMSSDLICGMSSMLLLESVILNKPVLSIQIGLKKEDPFILSQRNILKSIMEQDELDQKLEDILINNKTQYYNFDMPENPINNIISVLERYL